MILHKYKCIFIHIPRTGGTSIESVLAGKNWWKVHPQSKHLNFISAKKIYNKYWDDYFKFTFVRNPWGRLLSLTKYSTNKQPHDNIYPVHLDVLNRIKTNHFFDFFSNTEYDPRFFNANQFEKFKPFDQAYYRNIIGDEMDFIGKYENLQNDFDVVCEHLKIPSTTLPHVEKSVIDCSQYQRCYDDDQRDLVYNQFKYDIEKYNYEF